MQKKMFSRKFSCIHSSFSKNDDTFQQSIKPCELVGFSTDFWAGKTYIWVVVRIPKLLFSCERKSVLTNQPEKLEQETVSKKEH